jgi:hypothetical protein
MPADWPPGELMQSVTYRESFAPAVMPSAPAAHLLRELGSSAPQPLRAAAGAGWALVSLITAGAVAAVVVVLAVQVVRALT